MMIKCLLFEEGKEERMGRKDMVAMSQRELRRLRIIEKAMEGYLTQEEAGEIINLSDRQIRRILARVRKEGAGGIQHRSRGRSSSNAIPKRIKGRVLRLCRGKYRGFSPTFAAEKIVEHEGIQISNETLRRWFIEEGIAYRKRKVRSHRQWRERKHCYGEMVQVDGSHHDWFEGRGPKCVLMAYIDDATGHAFARFYPYEGTVPALDSCKRYVEKHGIPASIYLDKHQTYKSNREPTIEEQLNNSVPTTEFERAAREVAIEVIHAHSPQAKGRIERHFRTFQDRLVKEMRLRNISTIEGGNRFLETYLPVYNSRFSIAPLRAVNLHRSAKGIKLDNIFCRKTKRSLRNDYTVAHDCKLYQVESRIRAKDVIVEERLDGTRVISYKGKALKFHEIYTRPKRKRQIQLGDYTEPPKIYIPPADHPWREYPTTSRRLVASPGGDRSL
jgi:transposase